MIDKTYNRDGMDLISVLLLGLLSFSLECVKGWTIKQGIYIRMDETRFGMTPLSSGWPTASVLSCAVACAHWHGECCAFTYNTTTQICTPGQSVASASAYSLQAPGGNLYVSSMCDLASGFGIYSRANVTTCLWISTDTANFSAAEHSCHKKGGNLITVQTQEKLGIFLDIAFTMNVEIWVGADDRLTEDEFRWHNDGSVLDSSQRTAYFPQGQPDDDGNNEDCLEFHPVFNPLNDGMCDRSIKYICEKEPEIS